MIILDPLVSSVPFESDQAGYKDEVLSGEPQGLEAEDLLRGVIRMLFEVIPDQVKVVLGRLGGSYSESVALLHLPQNLHGRPLLWKVVCLTEGDLKTRYLLAGEL